MGNRIKITKKVLIMMVFISLLVYCQSSSNKEVKIDKNENFDLSGIYLKKSGDTLKYQLSLLKLDSAVYFYEILDKKDSSIYGNTTYGVFDTLSECNDLLVTMYTGSSHSGFNLLRLDNKTVRLNIDKYSDNTSYIDVVGEYIKSNEDFRYPKANYFANDKNYYLYEVGNSVSTEVTLYKYPYLLSDSTKVRLSGSDKLKTYATLFNFKGTGSKLYYSRLEHNGEVIEGWMKATDLSGFLFFDKWIDGQEHWGEEGRSSEDYKQKYRN